VGPRQLEALERRQEAELEWAGVQLKDGDSWQRDLSYRTSQLAHRLTGPQLEEAAISPIHLAILPVCSGGAVARTRQDVRQARLAATPICVERRS